MSTLHCVFTIFWKNFFFQWLISCGSQSIFKYFCLVCFVEFKKILHSSQFQGLYFTKSSNETLQNVPYFIYTKTKSCFFHFSCRATLLMWQILKRFAGTFRQAQTLKLGGVWATTGQLGQHPLWPRNACRWQYRTCTF